MVNLVGVSMATAMALAMTLLLISSARGGSCRLLLPHGRSKKRLFLHLATAMATEMVVTAATMNAVVTMAAIATAAIAAVRAMAMAVAMAMATVMTALRAMAFECGGGGSDDDGCRDGGGKR
jgi:hypothetical protein